MYRSNVCVIAGMPVGFVVHKKLHPMLPMNRDDAFPGTCCAWIHLHWGFIHHP